MRRPYHYIITIKVRSSERKRPDVRTLCGDTVFLALRPTEKATWTVHRSKIK